MRLDWPASSALARAVHANVIARTVKIYRYHRSSSAPAPPPSCVDSTQDRRQCGQLGERSAFADDGSQHRSPPRVNLVRTQPRQVVTDYKAAICLRN